MRLCLVATAFPRWEGDPRGAFVWEGARALARRGHTVRVVTLHSPGARTREVWEGVEVIRERYMLPERLELLQETGGGLPAVWRDRRLRPLFLPFAASLWLAALRHGRDADVVHAYWTLSAVGGVLVRRPRRPLVATVLGSDIYQAARLPGVAAVTRAVLRRADRITALSRSLRSATAALGVDPAAIEVVPLGVDTSRFTPGPADREPVLLFTGSLIERKGVHHLLEAMALVVREHPAARLEVVGDGPERARLEAQAARLDITSQVVFRGSLPPEEVAAAMRQTALFVLPSLEEGLGAVLLEAMASGTPCIASDTGGIPDAVTAETGRLVPPGDPAALAAAVIDLLEDGETRRRLAVAARERAVTCFDWNVVAARLESIYGEVMSDE